MNIASFFPMPEPVPVLDDTVSEANAQVVTYWVPMSGSDRALWPYQTRVHFLDPWCGRRERTWTGWWASSKLLEAEGKHYEVVASLAEREGKPWEQISADTVRVRALELTKLEGGGLL